MKFATSDRVKLSEPPANAPSSFKVASQDALANHLLAALPEAELQRWLPQLEGVDLPLGLVLYESGKILRHVYFPTTAIVSLLYVMEDGGSAEIAVVGNEGVVGISLFMGGESTPSRAVVQSAGRGIRLNASAMKGGFNRSGPVMHLMLRYTQALITQMAQTAVCNRHHTLDKQLCRWLLLSLDRLQGNDLVMTQELIANMLGVRREGVTEAALKLQTAGLIRYVRGHITVLDRPALELRTCECYAVVKREYDRLLPDLKAVQRRIACAGCWAMTNGERAGCNWSTVLHHNWRDFGGRCGARRTRLGFDGRMRTSTRVEWKEPRMPKLSSEERNAIPPRQFAFPAQRKEPLENASHVRNAVARFGQVKGVSDTERDAAWQRIQAAARLYCVELHEAGWRVARVACAAPSRPAELSAMARCDQPAGPQVFSTRDASGR